MTRILVAPDKFKGSLSASDVAAAVRRGLLAHDPGLDVVCLPVADGGDGTLEAAVAAGYDRIERTASGPTGDPVSTAYARQHATAVVEMADVSGLTRLPDGKLQPLTATSRGTGELIAAALDQGCRRIVLGIGGSACTDGGAGMLQALGARLRDENGVEIEPGGGPLADLKSLDLTEMHPALTEAEVVVACDVDNPLTGPHGAAAVYGPKGASPEDVQQLEANLGHWADLVAAETGGDLRSTEGAGAAGGVGFAAIAVLGATLSPGIDLVLDLVDFESHLAQAELVVVGEGSLDEQTLRGKAPAGVARKAAEKGVTVIAVCGRRALDDEQLRKAGISATYALADLEPDPAVSMAQAAPLLERVSERIGREHLPPRR